MNKDDTQCWFEEYHFGFASDWIFVFNQEAGVWVAALKQEQKQERKRKYKGLGLNWSEE